MKKLTVKLAVLAGAVFALAACSTTTTTTYYKEDGKTVDRVVVEQSVSDANALGSYLKEADAGSATDRSLDVTKFTLGYGDVGLAWLSVGGSSTRAPATEAASNNVLESMAKVKATHKTSIQTEGLAVNAKLLEAEGEVSDEAEAQTHRAQVGGGASGKAGAEGDIAPAAEFAK